MRLSSALVCPFLVLTLVGGPDAGARERYMAPGPRGAEPLPFLERFQTAARGPALEPWQRRIMLSLAAGVSPELVVRQEQLGATAPGGTDAWSPIPGPARWGHTGIYDPVRHRLIVFGGDNGYGFERNDVWALSLSGPPTWTELLTSGTRPPGRYLHSAIYDPIRDRMITFGGLELEPAYPDPGYVPTPSNDTWELALGSLTWSQLAPSGTAPPGRAGHTAIYDPVRDRMLVFGGGSGSLVYDDVWSLELSAAPSWSQVVTAGPRLARRFHSATYDSRRDQMIVFGGADSTGTRDDTWALPLSSPAWSQLIPVDGTRPAARLAHTAVYDSLTDRMFIFGWTDAVVWALSLDSRQWTPIAAPETPPARDSHAAILDPVERRMIIFGGYVYYDRLDGPRAGDTWAMSLDAGTWSAIIPTSVPPEGRAGHTAVYDAMRKRMIVFGGWNGDCYCFFQDAWQLSLGDSMVWSQLVTAGTPPTNRAGHTAVYDPVGDRMIVFGGEEHCTDYEDCSRPGNDTWALSLGAGAPTWSELTPLGAPPPERSGHTAVYDPSRQRMVIFGGTNFQTLLNDTWTLALSGAPAWSQLSASGSPPGARAGHSAIYEPMGDRMVVFGGDAGAGAWQNDTWALDLGSPNWQLLVPGSSAGGAMPTARAEHSAVYDQVRRRMLIHGGDTSLNQSNDTWSLSFGASPSWSEFVPVNTPPPPRWDHTAILDPVGNRMVVYAGSRGYSYDTWALALEDIPTPVLPSLVSARVEVDRVELDWFAADGAGLVASVYRRASDTDWRRLDTVDADGSGHLRYVDHTAAAGGRYAYRLAYQDHGIERFTTEAWVELPESSLALKGLRPNPAVGDLAVSLSLPSEGSARLDLIDVTGRVRLTRDVGTLGAGRHVVPLGLAASVPAGIYWLRLTQAGRVVLARGVVMH